MCSKNVGFLIGPKKLGVNFHVSVPLMKDKERELEAAERQHNSDFSVGTQLIAEASGKLKDALKNNDLKQAAVAQLMLDTAQQHMDIAQSKLQSTREELRTVNKRKQSAMDKFIAKKPKQTESRPM